MIEGLDWVKANHISPAVVVMALGGESLYALDLAVRDVVNSGLAVVVAAGNTDADACTKSPARCACGAGVHSSMCLCLCLLCFSLSGLYAGPPLFALLPVNLGNAMSRLI